MRLNNGEGGGGEGAADEPQSVEEVKSSTLHGLRWSLVARPATEGIALGSMVVLSRLIAPAEFGRFAIAAIVVDLAAIPGAGVGSALVQRASAERDHLRAGFALALAMGAGLVGVVLVAAQSVVAPVFGARTAYLVQLASPIALAMAAGTVPMAVLQRRLLFKRLAIMDISNVSLRAALSIGLAAAGMQGEALVLGALAASVLTTGLSWVFSPPPLPGLKRNELRELAAFGLPAAAAAVSWVGFRNCDYAIVGARLGALPAGLYYRSYTLAVEYQKKVSQLLTTVGFPVLARTRDPEQLQMLRGRMVSQLVVLLFPVLVLLAIVAPRFLPWFLGPAWSGAVVPTQILALGGASTMVIDAAGAALMATGRARAVSAFGWGHFLIYAVVVIVVAPLGLDAVAVGAACVHSTFLLVGYALLLGGSPARALRALWTDIAPAVVGCAGLAAAAMPVSLAFGATGLATLPYLIGVCATGLVAYALVLRGLYPRVLQTTGALVRHLVPQRLPFGAPWRGSSRRAVPFYR